MAAPNKKIKCPRCGYILSQREILRCPRCNMSLVEKCFDCAGCSIYAWEKKDDACTKNK